MSKNFTCQRETFRQLSVHTEHLLSTFRVACRPSVNFRQHSFQTGDLPSTFLFSIFVNFPCDWEIFCQLWSNFYTAVRLSVNCWQFTVQPADFPSTYINFLCSQETFCQLSTTFLADGRPSVNFRQLSVKLVVLPSTLYAAGRPSDNFRQLSVQPGCLTSTSVNFQYSRKTCVNLPCGQEIFCHIMPTLHATGKHSVNFRQLSVQPVDFPTTSVIFPTGKKTCQFSLTFKAAGRPSITFRQYSLWPEHRL